MLAVMAVRPFCALGLASALCLILAVPARATVSIVAVDPATGQVGIAGASCVQFDLARIATVLPGVGAALSQGHQRPGDPLRLLGAMRRDPTASGALGRVAPASPGTGSGGRQYGVVMLGGGTATHTDHGADPVAADASAATVLVVGSDLQSREVVDRAKDAFLHAPGDLAHRLIAGLKASSAAGGDRRCHSQTATAAFIIVASRGQRPVVPIRGLPAVAHRQREVMHMVGRTVAADQLGDLLRDAAGLKRPSGPGSPDLYLSLIQPAHGFNAVSLLSQAYRQLLATATPTPTPAVSPTSSPPSPAGAHPQGGGGPGAYLWVIVAVVVVGVAWARRRSRRRRRQALAAARAAVRTKT